MINPLTKKPFTKIFKRPCRRCDKIYQPTGRFTKFCPDCNYQHERWKITKKKLMRCKKCDIHLRDWNKAGLCRFHDSQHRREEKFKEEEMKKAEKHKIATEKKTPKSI